MVGPEECVTPETFLSSEVKGHIRTRLSADSLNLVATVTLHAGGHAFRCGGLALCH